MFDDSESTLIFQPCRQGVANQHTHTIICIHILIYTISNVSIPLETCCAKVYLHESKKILATITKVFIENYQLILSLVQGRWQVAIQCLSPIIYKMILISILYEEGQLKRLRCDSIKGKIKN